MKWWVGSARWSWRSSQTKALRPWQVGQWRLPQERGSTCAWPQAAQAHSSEPACAVRQPTMAAMTFLCTAGMVWPKCSRYAAPWAVNSFWSAPISEPRHDRVDQCIGVLVALAREVQVDHGGLQTGMPEMALDDAQVHPGFEQVGGIAVPQGMDRDLALVDAGFELGAAKRALDAALGHGGVGRRSRSAVAPVGRKQEPGVAVASPVSARSEER